MRLSEPKIIGVQAAIHPKCCHYWLIDSSGDNDSKGRCKLCGEERTFQNEFSRPPKRPKGGLEEAVSGDGTLVNELDDSAPDLTLPEDSIRWGEDTL